MMRSLISKHYPHALLLISAAACLMIVLTAPDRGATPSHTWPKQKEASIGSFDTTATMRSRDQARSLAEVLRQARARLERMQKNQEQEEPAETQQAAVPVEDDPQQLRKVTHSDQSLLLSVKPRYAEPYEDYVLAPDPLAWRRPEALPQRRYPLLEYGDVGDVNGKKPTETTSAAEALPLPPLTDLPTDDTNKARADDTPTVTVAQEQSPASPAPSQTALPVIASTQVSTPVVMPTQVNRAAPSLPQHTVTATTTTIATSTPTATAKHTVSATPVKSAVSDRQLVSAGHTVPSSAPIDDNAQFPLINKATPATAAQPDINTTANPDGPRDLPVFAKAATPAIPATPANPTTATPANPDAAQPAAPGRSLPTPAAITSAVKLPEQAAAPTANPHADNDKPEQARSPGEPSPARLPVTINSTPALPAQANKHATEAGPVTPHNTQANPLVVFVENYEAIGEDKLNAIRSAIDMVNMVANVPRFEMTTDPNRKSDILFREDNSGNMGNQLGTTQIPYIEDEFGNQTYLKPGANPTFEAPVITLNEKFNWYTGDDVNGIGDDEFDYQTPVIHELLHVSGLDDDFDHQEAVSFGELAPGETRRILNDLDKQKLAKLAETGNLWQTLPDAATRGNGFKVHYKTQALTAAVPEPASAALIGVGLFVGMVRRRRYQA